MNTNLSKFLNKVSTDKKLASEFFQNQNLKDLYAFALKHSKGGFSEQELQEVIDITEIYLNEVQKGELSEDDLEHIAGGDPKEETTLRSIAIMVGPLISLALTLPDIISKYYSVRKRYESEQDKLRIAELEQKLMKLQETQK